MPQIHQPRPRFMAVIEFDGRPAFPVPADSLEEAAYIAEDAAFDLPDVVRVPIYRWRGTAQYVLVQELHVGDPVQAP